MSSDAFFYEIFEIIKHPVYNQVTLIHLSFGVLKELEKFVSLIEPAASLRIFLMPLSELAIGI